MKQLIDMAARTLRIATRKSPLALWQASPPDYGPPPLLAVWITPLRALAAH